jgi:hypothetical protein
MIPQLGTFIGNDFYCLATSWQNSQDDMRPAVSQHEIRNWDFSCNDYGTYRRTFTTALPIRKIFQFHILNNEIILMVRKWQDQDRRISYVKEGENNATSLDFTYKSKDDSWNFNQPTQLVWNAAGVTKKELHDSRGKYFGTFGSIDVWRPTQNSISLFKDETNGPVATFSLDESQQIYAISMHEGLLSILSQSNGDRKMNIWDLFTGKMLRSVKIPQNGVVLCNNNKILHCQFSSSTGLD